jgi:antitoxin (DNA-binding transcriptional repressor) of toxin-antitoxin stability system
MTEMPTKHVIRVSEDRAAVEFRSLLDEVRAGAEVVIEHGTRPVAILHAAEPVRRSLSACIAIAKAHEKETGFSPVLDADFAQDVEATRKRREPWNPPSWEE